jgi:UDP-N-acetylglucosamine enolpyruvyl transferase
VSTLVIEGGQSLGGRVEVEGNKNSALPLVAACLLTEQECVLHNVPRIGDLEVMARCCSISAPRSTASGRARCESAARR